MIPPGPDLAAKLRGRTNKIRGDHAQAQVLYRLRQMGFKCIVQLETGWRVKRAKGKIIGASPMAKVSGDFRAVCQGGRSVLIEVKLRARDTLRRSDFQLHNRIALDEHREAGGLSLVAWVTQHGVAIFAWKALQDLNSLPWSIAEICGYESERLMVSLTTPEKP